MGKFNVVRKEKKEYTVEELKELFPSKKNTITEELAKYLNDAVSADEFNGDEFMKHLLTYQSVMTQCRGSLKDYINAVKFCAYLESEDSQVEAYKKARADDEFVRTRLNAPTDSVDYDMLANAASRFRKTPMVRQILAQSDMPLYLMFQGGRFQAAATLLNESMTAKSSRDRINAADKFLTHVKPPEGMKVELEIGYNKEARDIQQDLMMQLATIAATQKKLMEAGMDVGEAQKLGVNVNTVEAEYE